MILMDKTYHDSSLFDLNSNNNDLQSNDGGDSRAQSSLPPLSLDDNDEESANAPTFQFLGMGHSLNKSKARHKDVLSKRDDNDDDDDIERCAATTDDESSDAGVTVTTSRSAVSMNLDNKLHRRWSKRSLLMIWLLAGIGCSIGAYTWIRRIERHSYRRGSSQMAGRAISNGIKNSIQDFISSVSGFGTLLSIDNHSRSSSVPQLTDRLAAVAPRVRNLSLSHIRTIVNSNDTLRIINSTGPDEDNVFSSTTRSIASISQTVPEDDQMLLYYNFFDLPLGQQAYDAMNATNQTVLSGMGNTTTNPFSYVLAPIRDNDGNGTIVAFVAAVMEWKSIIGMVMNSSNICDDDTPVHLVVSDQCSDENQEARFLVSDTDVEFVGTSTDGQEDDNGYSNFALNHSCIRVRVEQANQKKNTAAPVTAVVAVLTLFGLTVLLFVLYDRVLQRHQRQVLTTAKRSNAILSSLFPEQVRSRLMAVNMRESKGTTKATPRNNNRTSSTRDLHVTAAEAAADPNGTDVMPKRYHNSPFYRAGANRSKTETLDRNGLKLLGTKPIADLFLNATILFADICDFTAWSSVRQPDQVFTLLEQIYNSFDAIAKRRRVFKVETIGDSYVAACGLPEPRSDHAEVMSGFAHECRKRMKSVVKRLEVLLGPDTAELSMRFGLHSGPVTAGVLRGEKSRFQLFGDTVNTASRIESTGIRNTIHLSEQTANLLIAADKEEWVRKREGLVSAKGKGMIQTYFLIMKDDVERDPVNANGVTASPTSVAMPCLNLGLTLKGTLQPDQPPIDSSSPAERIQRLIDWNVKILHQQVQKIIAMRDPQIQATPSSIENLMVIQKDGETVLDEVKEIIPLSTVQSQYKQDPEKVDIGKTALQQLHDYVTTIAELYHDNPFHNFEHASHVTQSVTKLLTRIVTADDIDYECMQYKKKKKDAQLHEYTFGITSDPIIQFACTLSALIHDADHTGLPNSQLVAEGRVIAALYGTKSVAEQNSVDLAWTLLMEPAYADLRACIYSDQTELERFRHLVVNSVMATDIVDKELGARRKARWAKAFNIDGAGLNDNVHCEMDKVNRKATIVIEHIIQASDVSHTMQHWHVYLKWNEKLFREMYKAYKNGKAAKDPADGWYKGELGFFDFYIIPLAKKLKDCGVFGVSSDEYLNYALANRAEWESKGEVIVAGYICRCKNL